LAPSLNKGALAGAAPHAGRFYPDTEMPPRANFGSVERWRHWAKHHLFFRSIPTGCAEIAVMYLGHVGDPQRHVDDPIDSTGLAPHDCADYPFRDKRQLTDSE
jgi:hypothetical protein